MYEKDQRKNYAWVALHLRARKSLEIEGVMVFVYDSV